MKKSVLAAVFSSVLILSACSGPTASEQLDTVLKDTFDAEKTYRETQGDMEELEKNEQQLFESTMALTQEQQDKVKKQVEEARASADERLELLEIEKESMNEAQENFKKLDAVIEEADNTQIKEDLGSLKTTMTERYNSHDKFAAAYETLYNLQQELYTMLLDENAQLPELQEKAMEVNEQNTAVQETVAVFNDKTEQFNELKNGIIEKLEKEEQ
ncbi:YkyA family protein [Planococcus shenhongbingii]|uniref:YkyA family protein n=1 Tax=Planococcus shenhongbingii TaxID=3058398 RepID=A0ABT8N9U3_9BACL|nr:YkyA family protein [Planococcus sp. N017]MDN7244325.1 YkyA family protein [Planococcus sp. N017]